MRRLGRPVPAVRLRRRRLQPTGRDGDRLASIGAKPHQVLTTKLFSMGERAAGREDHARDPVREARRARARARRGASGSTATTSDPAVRRFAMALGTVNTYTRPAADLDARVAARALQAQRSSRRTTSATCRGGWRSMYDVFIDELRGERRRADHRRAASITSRSTTGASPRPSHADARYEADAFVCTLPPQDAPAIAPDGSALRAEMQQWAGLEDVRALCMDLGFSRKVRDDLALVFDIERDLYYSVHSFTTPDLAPADGPAAARDGLPLAGGGGGRDAARRPQGRNWWPGSTLHFPGWRDADRRRAHDAGRARRRRAPDAGEPQAPGAAARRVASTTSTSPATARDIPYDLSLIILVVRDGGGGRDRRRAAGELLAVPAVASIVGSLTVARWDLAPPLTGGVSFLALASSRMTIVIWRWYGDYSNSTPIGLRRCCGRSGTRRDST